MFGNTRKINILIEKVENQKSQINSLYDRVQMLEWLVKKPPVMNIGEANQRLGKLVNVSVEHIPGNNMFNFPVLGKRIYYFLDGDAKIQIEEKDLIKLLEKK